MMVSNNARFGEVRSLLSQSQSAQHFASVCALWPRGDVPRDVIEYVRSVTARWPEQIPCAVPSRWRELVERGERCEGVAMCKTLQLGRGEHGRMEWEAWIGDHVKHRFERIEIGAFKRDEVDEEEQDSSLRLSDLFLDEEFFSAVHSMRLCDLVIDSRAAAMMVTSPWLSQLETLAFEQCHIDMNDMRELVEFAPSMPLKRLLLRGLRSSGGLHGDELCELWAGSEHLGQVAHLDMSGHVLSAYGIKALTDSRHARAIRSLVLTGQSHAWDALQTLVMSYWSSQLESLSVRDQLLQGAALQCVQRTPHLMKLRRLDLGHCLMMGEDLEALLGSHLMQRVESLDLSHNHLGDLGAYALSSAAPFAHLNTLGLAANDITDEGVELLHLSALCPRLSQIDLRENRVTRQGVEHASLKANPDCQISWRGDTPHRARIAEALERFHERMEYALVESLIPELERARWAASWFDMEEVEREEVTLEMRPDESPPDDTTLDWSSIFPELRYVTRVDISGSRCGVSLLRSMLGDPRITRVRHLDVSRSGVRNAELLAWMDSWHGSATLTSFVMTTNSRRRIRRVMGSPWFSRLERFTLECEPEIFEIATQIQHEYALDHVELCHLSPQLRPVPMDVMDTMER